MFRGPAPSDGPGGGALNQSSKTFRPGARLWKCRTTGAFFCPWINTWHSSPFLPRCRSRRALAEAWQGHAPCWASTTAAADWQRPQRACSRQFHVDTARIAKSCRGRHDRHREIMMRTQYLWLLEKERNSDGAQQRPQVTLVLRRSRSTSALAMRQPVAEPVTANPPETA